MKDWTGNKKTTFVTLGASNHSDKDREKQRQNNVREYQRKFLNKKMKGRK